MKRFFEFYAAVLLFTAFCPPAVQGAEVFSFTAKRDSRAMSDVLWARALMLAGADIHEADCLGLTAIFYAADAGNADTVALLLKVGAKADTLPEGLSPLHFAKNAETVNLLVKAGADVNARGPYVPLPPLMAWGEESRYAALLAAGADAKFRTENGWTALHFPFSEPVVRALLAAGANPNAQAGKEELVPLHLLLPDVCEMEYGEMPEPRTLTSMADKARWEELAGEDDGFGSWRYPVPNLRPRASRHGILAALLEAGAKPNTTTTMGVAPLHLAADAPATRMLLDAGANVRMLTVEGRSALFFATDAESLETLTAVGADVKQKDVYGETALFFAKDVPCAAWLIEKLQAAGQDPKVFLNEKSKNGRTVLHALCEWRGFQSDYLVKRREAWLETMAKHAPEKAEAYRARLHDFTLEAMLRVLLPAGADVNARDERGETVAFQATDLPTLKLLKEYGADLTVMNRQGETLLNSRWYALRSPEMVRFLVDEGVDINAISDDGASALASYGNSDPEAMKILLAAGANPNPETDGLRRFELPLMRHSDPECVRLLLEAGADVNARDDYGHTALHYLPAKNGTEKAELLLAAGADVNAKDEGGETPLFSAMGNPELVKIFIEAGADVNAKDEDGETPLFAHAFFLEDLETVKRMVEAGAETTGGPLGQTLLHATWSSEIMRYLIEKGADVNARDDYGRTPIFCHGSGEVLAELAEILVAAGADVNAVDQWGNTPLHVCAENVLPVLLAAGADVGARDNQGKTPLHCQRDEKSVRLLLAAGADVDATDNEGRTPLHELVKYHGEAAAVRALLAAGADVNAQDNRGRTPLFDVFSYNDNWRSVADVLLEAGANVNATDSFHRTPLYHYPYEFAQVQWMLANGADPNIMNIAGETPLFEVRRRSIYLLMLQAGADPYLTDKNGEPAPCVAFYGTDGKKNPGQEMAEVHDSGVWFDDEPKSPEGFGLAPPGALAVLGAFMKAEAAKYGDDDDDF